MAASKTIISMPLLLTYSFSRCPSSRTSFPPITAHLVLSNLVPTNINMAALVIIGSVNADIVLHIKTLPAKGETLDAARPDTGFMVPGGKGANQAVASARLSSEATRAEMVCRFGSDAHGETLPSHSSSSLLFLSSFLQIQHRQLCALCPAKAAASRRGG